MEKYKMKRQRANMRCNLSSNATRWASEESCWKAVGKLSEALSESSRARELLGNLILVKKICCIYLDSLTD